MCVCVCAGDGGDVCDKGESYHSCHLKITSASGCRGLRNGRESGGRGNYSGRISMHGTLVKYSHRKQGPEE